MAHTTYHDHLGRFTSKQSAQSVNKGGERFKVVRQHRRVMTADERRKRTLEAIQYSSIARQRLHLLGTFTGPGWVNVHDLFGE